MKVELEKAEDSLKAEFLQQLKEMGVDMTKYLTSLQPQFAPEQEIIVGPATTTVAPKTTIF